MNLLASPEFKVGLLVLIVASIIAGMSLTVSNDPTYLGTSKEAWFYIDDASGLVKNSGVRMAGIQVGVIKDIKLENGQARVEMILEGEVPVTKSARIEIRPNGILGDKHVEIVSGDPRDPPLRSGEQILVVDDRASVDRLIGEVSKITKSITAVAENIKAATEGDADKPLGRIVNNIEKVTSDLAEWTGQNKEDLSEIVANLRETTDTINELVNDKSDDGLKQTWNRSLARIDSSLKNIDEITGKINRGEGSIGKLINDEKTVEELNSAISGINNLLDTSNKLQTSVDFHTNYLSAGRGAKSFLSLRVQPGLDRYYELGVVDDPIGVTERTITTRNSDGDITVEREAKRYEDRVKFNALFAKTFWDITIKGGIIENSGGVGVDYEMFKRKFRLSLEAFDFGDLNLRATARYTVFHGIYFTGGGESLTKADRAVGFVGAGIFITNDDLKLLLTRMPF
ncbi:MAG TPA: MlaD family protein [Bdellovibrionales bacterium]|nr:MlaD family protein [Bdellovibrionales bacterium]